MPDSDVRIQVARIDQQITQLTDVQKENTQATTKLNNELTSLLIEMKESNVEGRHLRKEVTNIKETMNHYLPSMERSRLEQQGKDQMTTTMKTTWFKMAATFLGASLVAGVVMALKALM